MEQAGEREGEGEEGGEGEGEGKGGVGGLVMKRDLCSRLPLHYYFLNPPIGLFCVFIYTQGGEGREGRGSKY